MKKKHKKPYHSAETSRRFVSLLFLLWINRARENLLKNAPGMLCLRLRRDYARPTEEPPEPVPEPVVEPVPEPVVEPIVEPVKTPVDPAEAAEGAEGEGEPAPVETVEMHVISSHLGSGVLPAGVLTSEVTQEICIDLYEKETVPCAVDSTSRLPTPQRDGRSSNQRSYFAMVLRHTWSQHRCHRI